MWVRLVWCESPQKKICKGFPLFLSFGEGGAEPQRSTRTKQKVREYGERKNLELVEVGRMLTKADERPRAVEMLAPVPRGKREQRLLSSKILQGFPPEKEYAGEGSHPTQNESAREGRVKGCEWI